MLILWILGIYHAYFHIFSKTLLLRTFISNNVLVFNISLSHSYYVTTNNSDDITYSKSMFLFSYHFLSIFKNKYRLDHFLSVFNFLIMFNMIFTIFPMSFLWFNKIASFIETSVPKLWERQTSLYPLFSTEQVCSLYQGVSKRIWTELYCNLMWLWGKKIWLMNSNIYLQ